MAFVVERLFLSASEAAIGKRLRVRVCGVRV